MQQGFISADSHVSEVDETYAEIDPRFRETRPRAIFDVDRGGAIFTVPNLEMASGVPMALVCTAGRKPEDFNKPIPWEELHPAGHDPKARLAVQDEEGVVAEIIYPSMGMVLCNHPDIDYRKACFEAYNRWILRFSETDPERLVALPQISLRTVEEGIAEIEEAKRLGFKGIMLSGNAAFVRSAAQVVEATDRNTAQHRRHRESGCLDPRWRVSAKFIFVSLGIVDRTRTNRPT